MATAVMAVRVCCFKYRATVVENFETFWMDVQSPAITESSPGGTQDEGNELKPSTTVCNSHFFALHIHNSAEVCELYG